LARKELRIVDNPMENNPQNNLQKNEFISSIALPP